MVRQSALNRSSRGWIAAGTVLGLALVALLTSQNVDRLTLVAQLMCCVGAGVVVLRPMLGASLLGAIYLLLSIAREQPFLGTSVLALPFAIASLAAYGRRLAGLLFALAYLTLFLVNAYRTPATREERFDAFGFWLVAVFAPLLLGEGIWRLHLRSERQRKEQALAAERERHAIARDLHDHLAYATTTMVMKADQARLRGGHDPETLADLEYIAATGRSATADVRTMLALLRDTRESESQAAVDHGSTGLLPPTRLQEVLEAQRAKLAAFDFNVNLDLSGDFAALPDRQSAVLSRVLTEVASNITKHGTPQSEVSIMIDLGPDEVEAVMVNRPRETPADTGHRGLGLLGLREIVTAAGGTLTSSPVGDRWINHLTLPLGGAEGA